MIPVRRPILGHMVRFRDADRNDGIKKATDLSDNPFQLPDMGIGNIPLIGRRLHKIDRQCREGQPVATIGFAIDGEDFPLSCSTA